MTGGRETGAINIAEREAIMTPAKKFDKSIRL
jgi:hypothetical protein